MLKTITGLLSTKNQWHLLLESSSSLFFLSYKPATSNHNTYFFLLASLNHQPSVALGKIKSIPLPSIHLFGRKREVVEEIWVIYTHVQLFKRNQFQYPQLPCIYTYIFLIKKNFFSEDDLHERELGSLLFRKDSSKIVPISLERRKAYPSPVPTLTLVHCPGVQTFLDS